MRDSGQYLRKAYFTALNTGLSPIPVADEKYEGTADLYVILSSQSRTDQSNKNQFADETTIDIQVISKKEATLGKKVVETVANQIMEILLPTAKTIGFTIDAPFSIAYCKFVNSDIQSGKDNDNRFTLLNTLRFKNRITQ